MSWAYDGIAISNKSTCMEALYTIGIHDITYYTQRGVLGWNKKSPSCADCGTASRKADLKGDFRFIVFSGTNDYGM